MIATITRWVSTLIITVAFIYISHISGLRFIEFGITTVTEAMHGGEFTAATICRTAVLWLTITLMGWFLYHIREALREILFPPSHHKRNNNKQK
jgi:hypothetical protein